MGCTYKAFDTKEKVYYELGKDGGTAFKFPRLVTLQESLGYKDFLKNCKIICEDYSAELSWYIEDNFKEWKEFKQVYEAVKDLKPSDIDWHDYMLSDDEKSKIYKRLDLYNYVKKDMYKSSSVEEPKCICESLEEGKEKEIVQGDWNSLYIKHEDGEFYIEAVADGIAAMKMNYCPICGRKLSN